MKTGLQLIQEERKRQKESLGYSEAHDDLYTDSSLRIAGRCYWDTAGRQLKSGDFDLKDFIHPAWPWQPNDWGANNNPIRNLIKAGALFLAEAGRLSRAKLDHRPMTEAAYVIGDALDTFRDQWFQELTNTLRGALYFFTSEKLDALDKNAWSVCYWQKGFKVADAIQRDMSAFAALKREGWM